MQRLLAHVTCVSTVCKTKLKRDDKSVLYGRLPIAQQSWWVTTLLFHDLATFLYLRLATVEHLVLPLPSGEKLKNAHKKLSNNVIGRVQTCITAHEWYWDLETVLLFALFYPRSIFFLIRKTENVSVTDIFFIAFSRVA